jgi:hypothetical protein
MASYKIKRRKHATLVANTADTVTLTSRPTSVELCNYSSSAVIFFRLDGTAPTVSGDDTDRLGPGETVAVDFPRDVEPPAVGLISSATPAAFMICQQRS